MAKKPKMFVAFVLDETGSMVDVWDETISGYNKYVDELAADNTVRTRFTMAKFDSARYDLVHDAAKIGDIPHLTKSTYVPGAMTPLYDAIGKSIRAMEDAIADEDDPRVCVTILTDGLENASREYTFDTVQKLIEGKKGDEWTFVFLGSELSAVDLAVGLGVPRGNVAQYNQGAPQAAFAAAAMGTQSWTTGGGIASASFMSDAGVGDRIGWDDDDENDDADNDEIK